MYKEKIKITSIDVDCNFELKLSSLFKIMQEVASNHCESLGASHYDLLKYNLLWVVIRMEVKIYKSIKLDEVVTVTTHAGEQKSFIFPRYFQIYNKNGELLVNVSSIWAVINKDTRRVELRPQGIKATKPEHDKNDMPLPEKVSGSGSVVVDERVVKYSNVDINSHLNNTEYIEFILDTHDLEFYKHHRLCGININYDKEIKYGDNVALLTNKGEIKEIVSGVVNGVNHFTAEVEFEKR